MAKTELTVTSRSQESPFFLFRDSLRTFYVSLSVALSFQTSPTPSPFSSLPFSLSLKLSPLPSQPCRYKHFDWLYARLVERFPVISVPHLPEKQATGRFEEDFISKRRKGLIWWMNHMTSHPVLARCDVFQHFLTCGADEKAWKQGKRKAEKDELVGANFFLTIR